MEYQLALVMPVYNEAECIVEVVNSWHRELSALKIPFVMIVLNDGSKDDTAHKLKAFEGKDSIRVVHKPNGGHGPTILMGYRMAVDLAQWVFQTDSDDEMEPGCFPELWKRREEYDALFGVRHGREQGRGRAFISFVSRLTVRLLFGKGVVDVNTPYRLIRASLLGPVVRQIPDDTFAPNVIISGALARKGVRIYNHPVPHRGRRTGTVSIVRWKLWKSCCKSFLQTLRCRPGL